MINIYVGRNENEIRVWKSFVFWIFEVEFKNQNIFDLFMILKSKILLLMSLLCLNLIVFFFTTRWQNFNIGIGKFAIDST